MQTFGILFVAFIAVALVAILVMFMRERARMGIRPFELTDADKAQLKKMRRESGIRRLLAGFIGSLGAASCVAGITYPIFAASNPDLSWRDAFQCLALGAFLVFCAWLLVRNVKQ